MATGAARGDSVPLGSESSGAGADTKRDAPFDVPGAAAYAVGVLIRAGVLVVDTDERHYADVRGTTIGGNYVRAVHGDYDAEHSTSRTEWRLLAVHVDTLSAALGNDLVGGSDRKATSEYSPPPPFAGENGQQDQPSE